MIIAIIAQPPILPGRVGVSSGVIVLKLPSAHLPVFTAQ
jgi:hypothetical protein